MSLVGSGLYGSAVITFEPAEDGEDGQVIEVPHCRVSIVQEREEFWGSHSTEIHLGLAKKPGLSYLYRMKVIPGAITKGAKALYRDKHGEDPFPMLDSMNRTEIATRLRRKAKAVLDAAKA